MIKRVTLMSVLLMMCALASGIAADDPTSQEQQLANAIKEIRSQQAQIAENQTKIEAKLATIAEAVRVARIYSSRAGH